MITWERRDILAEYSSIIKFEQIARLRGIGRAKLETKHWERVRKVLSKLPLFEAGAGRTVPRVDVSSPTIVVGEQGDLSADEEEQLECAVRELIPWRKGPFELFGITVDAEWRSDFKWARIEPHLEPLSGKRVADLGCNNGYYMFRASSQRPELVVGFDPSER